MRESARMIIVLTLIAMASAGVLSQAYNYTYGIIQANLARELQSSIKSVLPGTVNVVVVEIEPTTMTEEHQSTLRERDETPDLVLYEGKDAKDQTVGFAFVSNSTGYGGVVRVLVGVDPYTMEVLGIRVVEHVETPGLGDRIEDASFRNQFVGKTKDDPITVGRDIDNISGATISAVAVADAVRLGLAQAIPAYEGSR